MYVFVRIEVVPHLEQSVLILERPVVECGTAKDLLLVVRIVPKT